MNDATNAPAAATSASAAITATTDPLKLLGQILAMAVRCNAFYQRGSIGMVLRVINTYIPTLQELGVPDIVSKYAALERGLVLVTGATGPGKPTTLAALINEINNTQNNHILTIEDPIEFLFTEKRSIMTQRELGIDTNTFADAMRAALREDPDVILLGEMRDPETIETALGR